MKAKQKNRLKAKNKSVSTYKKVFAGFVFKPRHFQAALAIIAIAYTGYLWRHVWVIAHTSLPPAGKVVTLDQQHAQSAELKPEDLDRMSRGDIKKHDKMSNSTDHITSKESVAGGLASATSSPKSVRIPVMIYHSVRPHYPGESIYQDEYDITPDLLDQELTYMESIGATTTTMKAVRQALDEGRPLPANPVILSFDDGWENQYKYAFPVLLKHHAVGTFYVYTGPVTRNRPHFLSWDEVLEMDRAGMEIGGHSRTHPVLSRIISSGALDSEILHPKEFMEKKLGHSIETFAYPFGYYNARVVAALERAGYKTARTVYRGVWVDPAHRLEMRGVLSTDDIEDFKKYIGTDFPTSKIIIK